MIVTFVDRAFSDNAMRGRNREAPLAIKEMDELARLALWNGNNVNISQRGKICLI